MQTDTKQPKVERHSTYHCIADETEKLHHTTPDYYSKYVATLNRTIKHKIAHTFEKGTTLRSI